VELRVDGGILANSILNAIYKGLMGEGKEGGVGDGFVPLSKGEDRLLSSIHTLGKRGAAYAARGRETRLFHLAVLVPVLRK